MQRETAQTELLVAVLSSIVLNYMLLPSDGLMIEECVQNTSQHLQDFL